MLERILHRGQSSGRADDNEEAGRKRLTTFNTQSMPVVQHYDKRELLKKVRVVWATLMTQVNAERPVDEIFQNALEYFPS
jgi:adenylate kinase family enzyme